MSYFDPNAPQGIDGILNRWGLPSTGTGMGGPSALAPMPTYGAWAGSTADPSMAGAASPSLKAPTGMFAARPPSASAALNLPDAGQLPSSLPSPQLDAPAPNVPAYHPHFFDKGGLGSKILGGIGEFALQYSAGQGNQGALAYLQNRYRMQQQAADDQRETQRQLLLEQARHSVPQIFNSGDGQILAVDPRTLGVTEVHGARPQQPKVSEQQSLIDYWNSLPATDPRRPLIERSIRGYQYSQPYLDERQANAVDLEDHRQTNRLSLKSTPTYGNLHPHSGTGKTGGDPGFEYQVINGKLMRRRKAQ